MSDLAKREADDDSAAEPKGPNLPLLYTLLALALLAAIAFAILVVKPFYLRR